MQKLRPAGDEVAAAMDTNPFDYIYTGKWVVMGRTYMKDTVFSEREASSAEFNEREASSILLWFRPRGRRTAPSSRLRYSRAPGRAPRSRGPAARLVVLVRGLSLAGEGPVL